MRSHAKAAKSGILLIILLSLTLFACSSAASVSSEQSISAEGAETVVADPSNGDDQARSLDVNPIEEASAPVESTAQIDMESIAAAQPDQDAAALQLVEVEKTEAQAEDIETAAVETDLEDSRAAVLDVSEARASGDTTAPKVVSTSVDGGGFTESFYTITATFNEAMNDPAGNSEDGDVTNPNNYILIAWDEDETFNTESCQKGVEGDDYRLTVNSVTYDNTTYSVELIVNDGNNLPNSRYQLFLCGTTTLRDASGNALLDHEKDVIREFLISTKSPEVKSSTLEGGPFASFNRFTVTFSEDMYDPDGNYDENDVTNPDNYRLIEAGDNGVRNTTYCQQDLAEDDVEISLDAVIDPEIELYSVSYDSETYTTTLYANGGAYLENGKYRFFVCGDGDNKVVDLQMNPLYAGVDDYYIDFVINSNVTDALPTTGFAPGVVTTLPAEPVLEDSLASADIWIEIPELDVQADVVGISNQDGEWDVTWLGADVGWLEGSAFPLWEGNSVLTGHSVNANGMPGVFAGVAELQYGDTVVLHAYGEIYTFEVRSTELVSDWETEKIMRHEEYNWLTLLTCENWLPDVGAYQYRRAVRAVLLSIVPE